jgi:hypothetical protein
LNAYPSLPVVVSADDVEQKAVEEEAVVVV